MIWLLWMRLWIVGGVDVERWDGGEGSERRDRDGGGDEGEGEGEGMRGKRWWWRRKWDVGRGVVTVSFNISVILFSWYSETSPK